MKMTIISLVVFASMFVVGAVPNAQARQCSNASLKSAYGFLDSHTVVPAGTPRVGLARETYDGKGNWTNKITLNNNGTVIPINDSGSYTVNADCTGTIFNTASGVTVSFVLVDGGKEIYRLVFAGAIPAAPGAATVLYSVGKKLFPDDNAPN